MEEIDPRQPHPHHHAGFFGNLFFTWINPLFEAGLKAPIEPSQLYEVQKEKTLEYLDYKFQQFRQKHPNQQILASVYGMVRQEYMFATILFVCGSAFQMLAPVIFHYFYDEFKEKEDEFRENKHELKTPAILAGLLLVNLYIRTLVINHANYLISNCGSKVANTLKSLVFKKMVHIDLLHLDYFVDTTLVNLLTVDMDHLTYGLTIIPNILAAFAVFALQFVFLYSIGYLTLALVLLLILWILLLRALHSQTKAAKHKLAKDSDAGSRVLKGLVLDCVNIKLNHYEPVIYRELIRHKEKESTIYKTYLKWSQMANLMTFIFPTLFGYIYFGLSIYTTQGTKDISLVDTYLVLTVLSILKTPLSLVNEALDKYPEYAVSSSRIQTFLEKILERKLALNGPNNEVKQTKTDVEKSEILLQGCSFGFNTSKTSSQMTSTKAPEASSKGSEGPLESVPEAAAQEEDGHDQAEGVQQDVPPTLGDQQGDKETDFHEKERPALGGQVLPAASAAQKKETSPVPLVIVDISLHISAGDRLALFGPAGSGKTFLLQSLLGETQLHSGKMVISGSTGYYPEEGIFSEDSILQNIVCGRDFDLERYQKALRLALLDQYIDKVHDKDGFILKNNAGNLYYKLRKRIMIARMLYDIPDIVIFDGFLDDQDSEYRQHVCQVIFGRESNNLKVDGSPVTLIVSTDREDVCRMVNRIIVLRDGRLVEEGTYSRLIRNKRGLFAMMLEKDVDALPHEDKTELKVIEEDPRESKEIARETVEEERISIEAWQKSSDQTSSVQVNFPKKVTFSWGAVLTIFFLNAGFLWPLSYLFFMVLSQIVIYSFTWLLAAWKAGKFLDSIEPYEYVIFYGGIMLTGLMAQWVTGVIFIRYFRRISFRLYVMIIRSLVSKNLDWYRAVSPSKILNACVTDYHEVDQLLGPSFNSFLQYFVKVNVGAILICYKTWLGGPLILILHCWLVFIITKRFLPVDRSLKQIMASNRSHMITTIMDAHKGILHYRNSGLIGHALENFNLYVTHSI